LVATLDVVVCDSVLTCSDVKDDGGSTTSRRPLAVEPFEAQAATPLAPSGLPGRPR
jgi:hypothetical protein